MSGDPYCPTHGFLPCSCGHRVSEEKYKQEPYRNDYYYTVDPLTEECNGVLVEKITALEKENVALRQRNLELEAEVVYFRERELRQKFPKRGRR